MEYIKYLLSAVIGYLFGSISWAIVIGKVFYGKDIREYGSGNPGATNAGRAFGKKAAYAVFVLDALKGGLIYTVFNFFDHRLALIAGFSVAIGHCWPLFSHFKGGKAVSTIYGILIAISNTSLKTMLIQVLIPGLIFFAIKKKTQLVSLASLTSLLVGCLLIWITNNDLSICITVTLLFILMAYRHKANIKRLIAGTETPASY